MTRRALEIRDTLRLAARLDRDWMHKPGDDDHRCAPWMPANVAQFLVLLIEALGEAQGDRFLGIGCGIGTKEMLAKRIFGLEVYGIDIVPSYLTQAISLGVETELADASTWNSYGNYDIVFFNRVYRDQELQHALEHRVWESMMHGAVVIAMNLEAPPPPTWLLVTDDWEARRGVWVKA